MSFSAPPAPIRSGRPFRMPIGISHFADLVEGGYSFVDKSLFIEDILAAGAQVALIARPRRFGKTLNLSMLRHFFAERVNGQPTRALFDGLAIAGRPLAMAHQGQYPVLFFSFKDIKVESFSAFEDTLRVMLSSLYRQYPELENSPRLNAGDRNDIESMSIRKATLAEMAAALRLLCELLHKHHGRKVVVLLDEYDTPIHAAYTHGFYQELIGFMRNLLGAALKDNPYLFKAVITGILRVSKESLFSDLNNIKVHTVLDEEYSACFGFTEPEVAGLIQAAGLGDGPRPLEEEIKSWYNGYRFGHNVIYNPWSIINCLDEKGNLRPYWVRTSGSDLLKKLMAQADVTFKQGLERLMEGVSAREVVDPNLIFGDLDGNATALWSLLLFSGYLTSLSQERAGTKVRCELAIPNREIRYLYEDIIQEWFTGTLQPAGYRHLLDSIASADVTEFEAMVRDYLLRSASFFDVQGRDPEKFYHGLILGMMVGLRDSHAIYSNRESGYGRYDMALFPKAGARWDIGVVLEFKQVRNADGLQAAAESALPQIDVRRYRAEMSQHPIKSVLAIGMAFCGKELAMASKRVAYTG